MQRFECKTMCINLDLLKQIHDGFLVHASDPNTSQRRRCGFVIRYVPTCAYPIQVSQTPRENIDLL